MQGLNKANVRKITLAILFVGVFIRCLAIIRATNYSTNCIRQGNEVYIYLQYAVLALMFFIEYIYCKKASGKLEYFDAKMGTFIVYVMSATFFVDFVHQIINCVNIYNDSFSHKQWNLIIPLGAVGICSLVSCVYYIFVALSYKTNRYDLSTLKITHFVPALWCLFALLTGFTKYSNPFYDVESFLYYFSLIIGIMFFGLYAINICRIKEIKTSIIAFFGGVLGLITITYAAPAQLAMIFVSDYSTRTFSTSTFIMVGAYGLFVCDEIVLKYILKED